MASSDVRTTLTKEEMENVTFHGVCAPSWADDERLADILREEAREDSKLHMTMWNSERDRSLLLHVADRIDALKMAINLAKESLDV